HAKNEQKRRNIQFAEINTIDIIGEFGAPDRIRTCDLCLRRVMDVALGRSLAFKTHSTVIENQ
ncbi:hypothetical protein, partial [Umezakia ovalisporum]|uniref:hypothetical protein n=1 Tax=Umezakia ovalisporum TaxID=75695 RepID=UPI0039C67034